MGECIFHGPSPEALPPNRYGGITSFHLTYGMAGQIHIVSKLSSMDGFRVFVDREQKPPRWAFSENDKGERLIIYGDFGEAIGLKNIARAFERSGK